MLDGLLALGKDQLAILHLFFGCSTPAAQLLDAGEIVAGELQLVTQGSQLALFQFDTGIGFGDLGLGFGSIGPRLAQRAFEVEAVDFKQHLALVDHAAGFELCIDGGHLTGHQTAQIDGPGSNDLSVNPYTRLVAALLRRRCLHRVDCRENRSFRHFRLGVDEVTGRRQSKREHDGHQRQLHGTKAEAGEQARRWRAARAAVSPAICLLFRFCSGYVAFLKHRNGCQPRLTACIVNLSSAATIPEAVRRASYKPFRQRRKTSGILYPLEQFRF